MGSGRLSSCRGGVTPARCACAPIIIVIVFMLTYRRVPKILILDVDSLKQHPSKIRRSRTDSGTAPDVRASASAGTALRSTNLGQAVSSGALSLINPHECCDRGVQGFAQGSADGVGANMLLDDGHDSSRPWRNGVTYPLRQTQHTHC
jgi:hypothetical protein